MKIKDRIVGLRRVRACDLLPNPKNWRTHPEQQQNAMRGILAEVGIADAMLARETPDGLMLIDGHLRADVSPDTEWPVLVLDVTEAEADKILATHDPLASMAGADQELLGKLLHDIEVESEALDKMLADLAAEHEIDQFDEPDTVEDVEPQSDRGMELMEQWGTAEGQLWIVEGRETHRLLCGDSTKADDVARVMGGEKADMCLTDPPYGVSYVGGTKDALTIENDALDEDSLADLVSRAFDGAELACRPGSYWYATVPPGPLHLVFTQDWKDRGILRQVMVWVKDSLVLGHSEYHYRHEPILFGWMQGGERRKNTDRTRTTVWEFDRPKASREHPTMKPVKLWAQAVADGSKKGDGVYDPFLGSGTTMLAAEQLGRKCYGIEISPQYCAVILQRMTDAGCECRLAEDVVA